MTEQDPEKAAAAAAAAASNSSSSGSTPQDEDEDEEETVEESNADGDEAEASGATKTTKKKSSGSSLGRRLASGVVNTVTDTSKQVFSQGEKSVKTAAKVAGNLSKKAATTAVKTVKKATGGGGGGSGATSAGSTKTGSAEVTPSTPSLESNDLSATSSNERGAIIAPKPSSVMMSSSKHEASLSEEQHRPSTAAVAPGHTSSTDNKDDDNKFQSSFPSLPALPGVATVGCLMEDDRMIFGVVVASIALVQTLPHLSEIFRSEQSSVPLSVAASWMLVAFALGMEIDGVQLMETIKYYLLGPNLATSSLSVVDNSSSSAQIPTMIKATNAIPTDEFDSSRSSTTGIRKGSKWGPARFVSRVLHPSRPQQDDGTAVISPKQSMTSLKHSTSFQEQVIQMRFDALFANRLARFGRKMKDSIKVTNIKRDEEAILMDPASTTSDRVAVPPGGPPDHSIGRMDAHQTSATVLLSKMQIEPLCRLRGLDVFLTDCAESPMSTHPFLLRNGLRSVPTFVVNMMTQWGSVLIYFELPDWVVDNSSCLVEQEDDRDNVKALKRFLAGDDEYRKHRLKIIFEFVAAPYPVRLLAPKNSEIPVFREGFIETPYHVAHEPSTDDCPIWEVTFDFMGNSAIRGMASIVKRYLGSMSVDFGLVLSKPDEQKEEEPEGVLGVWRFDHINVPQYPSLPDRFETEGSTPESVDVARASLLVQEASKRVLVGASTAS